MSNNKVSIQVGPGFLGVLTIAFIVLKLMEVINWSWWWVLSPLWLPWVLILVVMGLIVLVAATFLFLIYCVERFKK